ncbi:MULTISPECIES: restriction endonuclease subunit S [unclassified Acinetobacter]|uniref:restriction endonuclease subunit S n=1 Tax=unclassified Acinetobacter TaxID=196816 RepID=UPI0015D31B40|nr:MULTISPECIES: restriction endonuclease subunit S [unclassified Acinetobacter]
MTQIVKIGDISTQIRGVSYSKNDAISNMQEGYLPVLRANNIQEQGLILEDFVYVPESEISEKQRILAGDVLIAASSGSISLVGKAASAKEDIDAGFGAFCKILRPNTELVDPRYFANYFQTQKYRQIISNLAAGANINNLKNEHLDDLEIPLPPLTEQRRIASILDQADELRQKRQQAIEKLDQLLQSTFIEMFGDPVSNPKGWEKVEVGKVTTCIVPGRDKPKSFTGSIPWITTDDLNSLGYTSQSKKRMGLTQTEIDDVRAKVIPFQSVVMSCVGNLGITSIANNEFVMNQQLHSYQCLEQITPEFLMFCLPFEKNYMFSRATSTTLPYMNKSVCNSVPVILPPIDLQEKWSKILLNIEEHKQSLYKQLDMQNQLFSALQNQAFNGTL